MQHNSLKIIFYSYLIVITVGTLLLLLPYSQYGNVNFFEALFTATSATCVTGLIIVSTSEDFTFFGQLIILLLIQIGGIGYMSLVSLFYIMIKNRLNLQEKQMARESISGVSLNDTKALMQQIFVGIIIIEFIGASILIGRFMNHMPLEEAVWQGIFHSVSAFNNAGFSLFQDSIMQYSSDSIVLMTISILIILGGVGYLVLIELWQKVRQKNYLLSVHSKIILLGTSILLTFGVLLLLSLEYYNQRTFANLSFYDKILNSLFLSVNLRTAGFNSIDIGALSDSSLFFSTIFMMIGGGPGGTAGGIKITVFIVLSITFFYSIKSPDKPPHIFSRTIGYDIVNKSIAILLSASFLVIISTILLVETQRLPFIQTLFEVVSAFATVGVSTGNGGILSFSAQFNSFGQSIIIILMLTGRIGIFAFSILLMGREKQKRVEYPKGRIYL